LACDLLPPPPLLPLRLIPSALEEEEEGEGDGMGEEFLYQYEVQ